MNDLKLHGLIGGRSRISHVNLPTDYTPISESHAITSGQTTRNILNFPLNTAMVSYIDGAFEGSVYGSNSPSEQTWIKQHSTSSPDNYSDTLLILHLNDGKEDIEIAEARCGLTGSQTSTAVYIYALNLAQVGEDVLIDMIAGRYHSKPYSYSGKDIEKITKIVSNRDLTKGGHLSASLWCNPGGSGDSSFSFIGNYKIMTSV